MTCTRCNGSGSVDVLIRYTGGICAPDRMNCRSCNGTGRLSDERVAELDAAEALRKDRIARGESLREAAAHMGISVVERSDMEHGKRPIPEEMYAALDPWPAEELRDAGA